MKPTAGSCGAPPTHSHTERDKQRERERERFDRVTPAPTQHICMIPYFSEKEVTVSFLQMGEDPDGLAFLTELDKGFGTRFDIVDTLSAPKVRGNGFLDTIKRRLQ